MRNSDPKQRTSPSAVRCPRRGHVLTAASVAAGAVLLSSCASAGVAATGSATAGSSTPSRASTVTASGTFDLLATPVQTSVGANLPLGSFTAPSTGNCALNGTISLSWGPQGGSGTLGWIVVTPGLQAGGQGVGSVAYTGAHGPTTHDTISRGGSAEADWPVSGTVAVTRGRPVALTFGLGGYAPDRTGIRYSSALTYVCP